MAKAAKILVIDDDDAIRDGIVTYLAEGGFELFEASDGVEGIQAYEQHHPDVVLCDLNMPNKDGMGVLKYLKESGNGTPAIVISGVGVMSDVVEALRLGAADYFSKPIADLEVLEYAVKRCLAQRTIELENELNRAKLEQVNKELRANLKTLEADQQAGRQLQIRLLPESPQLLNGYRFEHKVTPSLCLSGDFVDYMAIDDDKISFLIADVSGHGASSAFVTALLKNFIAHRRSDFNRRGVKSIIRPTAFLKKANTMLLDAGMDKHMTMCFGVIDISTNQLTYSVAGHLPLPVLVSGDDAVFLPGEGMPVGLFEDPVYKEKTVSLPDEFSLYLFTDGILEIIPTNELIDKELLLLEKLSASSAEIDDVCRRLKISPKAELPDDIAILTISKG